MAKTPTSKTVETLRHDEARRPIIPTAEMQFDGRHQGTSR